MNTHAYTYTRTLMYRYQRACSKTHIHMHIHTYIHTYARVQVSAGLFKNSYTRAHTYIHTHNVCLCIVPVGLFKKSYIHVYTYTYTRTLVYRSCSTTHIHIHTYTHTHVRMRPGTCWPIQQSIQRCQVLFNSSYTHTHTHTYACVQVPAGLFNNLYSGAIPSFFFSPFQGAIFFGVKDYLSRVN